MEVILRADVEFLGGKNEVVKVKNGYARNYLLPRKLAIKATEGNLNQLAEKIRIAEELRKKRMGDARELARKLQQVEVRIVKRAGKEGRLFGSVTAAEVAQTIEEISSIPVDKRKLTLPDHIKNLGVYTFQVRLDAGVSASMRLEVIGEEEALAEQRAYLEEEGYLDEEESEQIFGDEHAEAASEAAAGPAAAGDESDA